MNTKRAFPNEHSTSLTTRLSIRVLVVDDDSTTLAVVSAILRTLRCTVVSVNTPVDALSHLRASPRFDLVLTDLHMPQMKGIQLQKQIVEEFKLPLIVMSADSMENSMLRCLKEGAAFYLLKPIKADDLKSIWQYTIIDKNRKTANLVGSSNIQGGPLCRNLTFEDMNSASSTVKNHGYHHQVDWGRKVTSNDKQRRNGKTTVAPKKAKIVWTDSLHNLFLEAISHLGLAGAVPKKILEYMNVPGLTRENVASHLQKFRLFLEKNSGVASARGFSSRGFKSRFASDLPNLTSRSAGSKNSLFLTQQRRKAPFGYTFAESTAPGTQRTSQQSPRCNVTSQMGYNNLESVINQSYFQNPEIGNQIPLLQPIVATNGMLLDSAFSNGLTNSKLRNDAAWVPRSNRENADIYANYNYEDGNAGIHLVGEEKVGTNEIQFNDGGCDTHSITHRNFTAEFENLSQFQQMHKNGYGQNDISILQRKGCNGSGRIHWKGSNNNNLMDDDSTFQNFGSQPIDEFGLSDLSPEEHSYHHHHQFQYGGTKGPRFTGCKRFRNSFSDLAQSLNQGNV